MLIATQGFADLGLVTPDFIVPSGFLFIDGGNIDFAGVEYVIYSVIYTALPTDGTLSRNADGSDSVNSPTNFAGSTGTVQGNVTPNVITGTEGADSLPGTAGDDIISAAGGNDTLNGAAGNDSLDGGTGVDTALYSGNRAAYAVSGTAPNFTVSGPDGADTLTSIERLEFSDRKLAFDLGSGEAAGNTVRIIGAAFDTPFIIPQFVGIGIDLFDGGMSMLDASALVIGTGLFQSLAGSSSNEAFVNLVFQNVVGVAPSDAQRATFVGMLVGSGGAMTQAELLVFAANHDLNAVNIDLVGLEQSGVAFV